MKRHARLVLENEHFTPERVRRFVNGRIPNLVGALSGGKKNAEKVAAAIVKEIEKPTTAMEQSFRSLPEEHQAFPVSMLDVGADTHDK